MAQSDVSAEVARAARDAFTQLFNTPAKQHKAIRVCLSAVLDYLQDILVTQTTASLADAYGQCNAELVE